MSEADAQLTTIKAVVSVLRSAGVSAWLFGGWGLDAGSRSVGVRWPPSTADRQSLNE